MCPALQRLLAQLWRQLGLKVRGMATMAMSAMHLLVLLQTAHIARSTVAQSPHTSSECSHHGRTAHRRLRVSWSLDRQTEHVALDLQQQVALRDTAIDFQLQRIAQDMVSETGSGRRARRGTRRMGMPESASHALRMSQLE